MSQLGGVVSDASLLQQLRQRDQDAAERAALERADEAFARQLQAQLDAEEFGTPVHTGSPASGMPELSHRASQT